MIVESCVPHRIGDIIDLPEFEFGPSQTTRARIVCAATEEEYIADCLADPTLPEDSRRLMVVKNNPNRWWYEVEAD